MGRTTTSSTPPSRGLGLDYDPAPFHCSHIEPLSRKGEDNINHTPIQYVNTDMVPKIAELSSLGVLIIGWYFTYW